MNSSSNNETIWIHILITCSKENKGVSVTRNLKEISKNEITNEHKAKP